MRRRRLAVVVGAAGGVVVFAVALVPGLTATRFVAPRLSQAVGAPVRIGWAWWNPLSGTWTVRGVRVAATAGRPALSAQRIAARVYLFDVLRRRLRVRDVALEGARVRLRGADGRWELPLAEHAASTSPSTEPWPVTVDAGHARRTTLRFEPRHGRASLLRLRRLELAGALAASGSTRGSLWLRGRLDRATVVLGASFRRTHSSERVRAAIDATRVDLGRALRLVPVGAAANRATGRVDVQTTYRQMRRAGHGERRLGGHVRGDDLAFGEAGRTGVRARAAVVERFDVDLDAAIASFGKVTVRDPEAWLIRDDDGIVVPGLTRREAPAKGDEGAAPVWRVTAAGADLEGGTVHYLDTRGEERERTFDLDVEHGTIGALGDAAAPVPFAVTATLPTGGRVEVTGGAEREPLHARADLAFTDVELAPLTNLMQTPVRLAAGRGNAHLSMEAFAEGLSGSGTIDVDDLKTESPDPARPEDILACKTARVAVRHFQSAPLHVDVESIELDWPYVLIDRAGDHVFPLSLVALTPPSPADATAVPGSVFTMRADRLAVHDGRIDFRDQTLTPPYWRSLARCELSATPFALPPVRVPRLRADGLVDEISPVHVEGTVGTTTRLRADVKEVPLQPFNPYLEPASQYSVSSGRLTMHSEITLDRAQLDVDNRVVLSRFGLGSSAEEDFLKRELGIPLTLAVALMKDYRGNIELALPFGGNLNSPTFSLRQLVLQAVVHAIRGAVLSPLNALGRVFLRDGRIEDLALEPIPFPPGDGRLDQAGRERVVQVIRVLGTHPDLALAVRGQVAEADVTRLQEETVLAALPPKDRDPLRAYLEARRAGAPPPPLAADQRRRLETLTGALSWPGEQLRQLADDRSAAVAAAFLLEGQIAPDRIRVETADVPAPGALAAAPAVALRMAAG